MSINGVFNVNARYHGPMERVELSQALIFRKCKMIYGFPFPIGRLVKICGAKGNCNETPF